MYKVSTRDVDGSSSRKFKTRAAAIKRFESMVGYTMQQVIDERCYMMADDQKPTPDTVHRLSGVSMFGTVVTFVEES